MSGCVKCGSKKAYWTIKDKDGKTKDYCDPCFKKYDLAEYKKEMDEYHNRKKEESIAEHRKPTPPVKVISRSSHNMYDIEISKIAKWLINKHGNLVEVRCVSGYMPCRIELKFSDGEQIIVGEHSAIWISL